jgi:hypothetical protein
MISRVASVVVALTYLLIALVVTGGRDPRILLLAVSLLPPLALIWFPDLLGSALGSLGSGRSVNRETPPVLIVAAGWFLLVGLPVILYLLGRPRT